MSAVESQDDARAALVDRTIATLRAFAGDTWKEPLRTTSPDGFHDDVVLEWWSGDDRKLTLYVSIGAVSWIFCDDVGIWDGEFEPDQLPLLHNMWRWLQGGPIDRS